MCCGITQAAGPGERLLNLGLNPDCSAAVPLSVMILCDDSLKANAAVFRELRNLIAAQASPPKHAALDFRCVLHSISLIRRTMILGFPDFWSNVVRLGHLFESSSYRRDFTSALKQVIASSFRRIPVHTMPEESEHWRRKRAAALKTLADVPSEKPSSRFLSLLRMEAPWFSHQIVHPI